MRRREGEREGGSTLGFSHELPCLLSIILFPARPASSLFPAGGSGAGCPPNSQRRLAPFSIGCDKAERFRLTGASL